MMREQGDDGRAVGGGVDGGGVNGTMREQGDDGRAVGVGVGDDERTGGRWQSSGWGWGGMER